jgi:hypothetical protein
MISSSMNNLEKDFLMEVLAVLESGRAYLARDMLAIFLNHNEPKLDQPAPDEPSKA